MHVLQVTDDRRRVGGFTLALALLLAAAAVALSAAPAASAQVLCDTCFRLSAGQLKQTLPTPQDLPGYDFRSAVGVHHDATTSADACADGKPGKVRASRRWASSVLAGGTHTLEVSIWSYGGAIDPRWQTAVRSARTCAPSYRMRTPEGEPAVIRQRLLKIDADTIELTAIIRSGGKTSSLTAVVTRADDAIQTALVRRNGRPTVGDLALARRATGLIIEGYVAARAATKAPAPLEASSKPPGEWTKDTLKDIPTGTAVAVSLGDSFISGEAGRWRGNVGSASNSDLIDLGPRTYWDTSTGESEPGCHRATTAEIHFRGIVGVNLACSGAISMSKVSADGHWKPGIDDGAVVNGLKRYGQLTLLDAVARRAQVKLIVLSIGGNDMGFADVVISCVLAFMKPWPFSTRCQDDPAVQAPLSDAGLADVGRKVQGAIERIHTTMAAAGYTTDQWQMIVQSYPLPIAENARYPETYWGRLITGGCPFYDADVQWISSRMPYFAASLHDAANRASAVTGHPIAFMDLTKAFLGRRLCSKSAAFVDELPEGTVRTSSAERVAMLRVFAPWVQEEAIHPNALGQEALRVCLEQAWNGGAPRSGACLAPTEWADVDADGSPKMQYVPTPG